MRLHRWPASTRKNTFPETLRAGKPEWRVKEHSGHESWETFNQYVEEAGTFQDNPAEDIGLWSSHVSAVLATTFSKVGITFTIQNPYALPEKATTKYLYSRLTPCLHTTH
jgi:hypothetical protein